MMKQGDFKFCVDCRHYKYYRGRMCGDYNGNHSNLFCERIKPVVTGYDLVTGAEEKKYIDFYCRKERKESGGCGIEGKYFEPK